MKYIQNKSGEAKAWLRPEERAEELRYTPEMITELAHNEIFVFGSNTLGIHAGGAARIAHQKFGIKMGKAEGLEGQAYAIPTMKPNGEHVTEKALQKSINKLVEVVLERNDLLFYLTKIGTGIAGWDIEVIKRLLWYAISEYSPYPGDKIAPSNLILPIDFY